MTSQEIEVYMNHQQTLQTVIDQMEHGLKALKKALEEKKSERSLYTSENLERFQREGITT